ncbi:MAG: class I SAM-dependent methyltransferase, partial [Promethearchaeota archaeon]
MNKQNTESIIDYNTALNEYRKVRMKHDSLIHAIKNTGISTAIKGVEIGVRRGEFSVCLISDTNCLELFLVDPYKYDKNDKNTVDNEKYAKFFKHAKLNMHRAFSSAKKIKNELQQPKAFTFYRMTSKVASTKFNDESLDFVYIDANHAYDYVYEDLSLWYPKLKAGGI